MNTSEFLTIASSLVPDRTAMVCEGDTRTFAQLQERVNRLANALQSLGVSKGEKVAVMALNSMTYVEMYYACARLGMTFVPLNYRAKRDELAYMVNNSEASVLFVGERYLELAADIKPQMETVKHMISIDTQAEGMANYEELLAAHEPEEIFT
ncbi:MAG: AMP-binding protein, partial [Dehalococcoidia bacterium]